MVTIGLSRCARPGLSRKGQITTSSHNIQTSGYRIRFDFDGCTLDASSLASCQVPSPRPEDPVLQLLQHTTSLEVQLTQTAWKLVYSQQTPHYSPNKSPTQPWLQGVPWSTSRSWTRSHRCEPQFLRKKQETTCIAFCNYLESKGEGLEEKNF